MGARIREAREAMGLSQVQFAELLEQGERTIQAWEYNARTPRPDALLRIAQRTKRPVAFFYGDGVERAA